MKLKAKIHLHFIFYSLVAFFISTSTINAQDIHFSQYFNSPLSTNPANTGNFYGDWRVSGNYRSQWKPIDKPYVTNSVGFDRQFYLYNEKLSGGLYVINDKSAGSLQVLKVMLSAAYHKTIKGHELHAGIQGGYVKKSFDLSKETFPDQLNWSTGHFDSKKPSNETLLGEKLSYFDLNIGAGWNKKISSKLEPYFSVALFHLDYPKESFFNNKKSRLKPRKSVAGGIRWQIADKVVLVPGGIWMQTKKAAEFILGSNVEFMLVADKDPIKTKYVYGGIHARTGDNLPDGYKPVVDAGFIVAGLKYAHYNVGLSYDVNVSPLKHATNSHGAFEIAFIYTGISTRLTKTEIPCDRY